MAGSEECFSKNKEDPRDTVSDDCESQAQHFFRSVEHQIVDVANIYADRCDIRRDRDWYLLKLQEEVGELVNAHLIRTSRSRRKLSDEDATQKISDEIADVFAQLVLYAKNEGIDLPRALERKWFAWLKNKGTL